MRLLPLAALLIPTLAAAQAQPPAPPPPAEPARPDIEFAATVQMESIGFGSAPRAQLRFRGGPRLDTRHDVEREGLPRPVAAGRTYRDVTVHTTISATLLDPALEARVDTAAGAPIPASPPNDEDLP